MTPASGFFQTFLTDAVFGTAYFWLPIILGYIAWKFWIYCIRYKFIANAPWVTLEIKIPRDVFKSPQAMEVVLNGISVAKDGNFLERYGGGFLRSWYSLEIASFEGNVHFYIRVIKPLVRLATAQFYGQYPDIEITEVEDYTKALIKNGKLDPDYKIDGMEFILDKEDVFPIKTYIDYGLDNLATKEEQKTDPITSLIEFFGSMRAGEHTWFQILIRTTKNKKWKDQAKEMVDKLMKRDVLKTEVLNFGALLLSPGERGIVEAIERGVSKVAYDVGIRFCYIARKDKFNSINIASIASAMKQFNALNLNGFRGINRAEVEYFSPILGPKKKRRLLNGFINRSYFHPPEERKYYILNTEELATIFHFPGGVSETPTFGRIEAKKSEPPTNLPL